MKESIRDWPKKAKARSMEKFGYDIIGIDLDKLKESIDEELSHK